jgi:hypothetical protein
MAYNATEVRGGEFIGHFDFNFILIKNEKVRLHLVSKRLG